jgi:hypothetical protein
MTDRGKVVYVFTPAPPPPRQRNPDEPIDKTDKFKTAGGKTTKITNKMHYID